MRKIEWKPGTYKSTKEKGSAIAWAANRRGHKPWVGKNVTAEISEYLTEFGYSLTRPIEIMKVLVRENYAYMRLAEGGKRVLEFGFMPDVDLSGHSLPKTTTSAVAVAERTDVGLAEAPKLPPIPAGVEAPPYRLDELEKLLKAWHEQDPDTYATWIDAAVESLQTNT